MKIAYVTAGAGGMYCGSCLRDNALAAELLKRGHDVTLIPTYTPTRTDESNVSEQRVFLGGINVFLQQRIPLFRKRSGLLDRLLDAPALLRLAAGRGVRVDPARLGELAVSMLRGLEGNQRKEIERLASFVRELEPDVVNLPNALLVGLAPSIRSNVRAPIVCTLQGEDLFLGGLPERDRREALALIRQQLASVDLFAAVSEACAASMAGLLGIPRASIRVVPLGINLEGHGPVERDPEAPFTVGYLARIAPEKGLDRLCDAYRLVAQREGTPASRLRAAGYLAPEHRPYLQGVHRKMKSWGLGDRFEYAGELDRAGKIEFLRTLSVLSVPGRSREPKGIYLLEAMANAVPVVEPRSGAFVEVIEKTGGGILVERDSPEALARGILELRNDPARRAELGRLGREGVRRHYSVAAMADATLEIYAAAAGTACSR